MHVIGEMDIDADDPPKETACPASSKMNASNNLNSKSDVIFFNRSMLVVSLYSNSVLIICMSDVFVHISPYAIVDTLLISPFLLRGIPPPHHSFFRSFAIVSTGN